MTGALLDDFLEELKLWDQANRLKDLLLEQS